MSDIKNKNHILATIDQLRSRKSRPDIQRICKFMLKFYRVTPRETKADIRRCIKEKSIVKVDYKDNVSYRNAAKWRKDRKTSAHNKKLEMSSVTENNERRMVTSTIVNLIYQHQSYIKHGVTFDDLIKAVSSHATEYSKRELEVIIQKEISFGSLVRLSNGNFTLGDADLDADSSDSTKFDYNADSNTKMTSSANSSCRSSPLRMRGRPRKREGESGSSNKSKSTAVRVGERRKMAKKVFDPSDNNLPCKRKRGRPVGSLNKSTIKKRLYIENARSRENTRSESQASNEGSDNDIEHESNMNESSGGVCSICHVQKPRGSNDKLIECRDCNNKAHMSCLQSGTGILKLQPDSTWQCPHCKTCVVCCETNDAGILTVCSVCLDAYHVLCHNPRIPEKHKAWDEWVCNNCDPNKANVIPTSVIAREDIVDSNKQDPFLKAHEIELSKLSEEIPIDPSIPDISNWSTDDVYEYFLENMPVAADILKEQDIDGQALSMARRNDIVRGLGLPLGPGLALYQIVVKLQTRKDDWTMCWG